VLPAAFHASLHVAAAYTTDGTSCMWQLLTLPVSQTPQRSFAIVRGLQMRARRGELLSSRTCVLTNCRFEGLNAGRTSEHRPGQSHWWTSAPQGLSNGNHPTGAQRRRQQSNYRSNYNRVGCSLGLPSLVRPAGSLSQRTGVPDTRITCHRGGLHADHMPPQS